MFDVSHKSPNSLRKGKAGKRKSNALRDAQLQGIDLLVWQKFGYGRVLYKRYYQAQGIIESDEWPLFEATLASPLPLTFRVHASHPGREDLLQQLCTLGATPLPWMPDGTGWSAPDSVPRRGAARTPFGRLLADATSAGIAARQVCTAPAPHV
jgi:hypothetical protein